MGKERVVNITPTASAHGLREMLENAARSRGKPMRPFVGRIYAYAVQNQGKFRGPLRQPMQKPGLHIGATVEESVANKLKKWAKEEQTSRGMWCCYLLEKALQDDILDKVFGKETS